MKIIVLFLLLPILSYSQRFELKTEIVEWKTGKIGKIIIEGSEHDVFAKWDKNYESLTETMLFTPKHRVLIQKSPTMYYKTTYFQNGRIECEEIPRNWFWDVIVNMFFLPQ